MKKDKINLHAGIAILCLWLGVSNSSHSMGLRSFVALPVEKGGTVLRLAYERSKEINTDFLTTSVAHGFTSTQTFLLSFPYRLSPAGGDRQGDVSVLYRDIVWQEDVWSGTDRLGLMGGVIIPTEADRDSAVQAGFVYTHFKNRHELDVDALYQAGMNDRTDAARFDISWQYRLSPVSRPDWGIAQELNSVLELAGRWDKGNNMTHQLTVGLQWIQKKLVIEGGVIKDINNTNETRYLLSTRFHF